MNIVGEARYTISIFNFTSLRKIKLKHTHTHSQHAVIILSVIINEHNNEHRTFFII